MGREQEIDALGKGARIPSTSGEARAGVVYLVGAGPGDPDLMTVRAVELLATADVVLHDELVHPSLLAQVRPDAEVRYVGKRGHDRMSKDAKQAAIDAELCVLARAGRSVVRLKGGDPFLFGRGSEEAEALARAGLPFEIVPGVCSPLGAAAYAGISLTHRDLASSVIMVSAVNRAGAPYDWSELASVRGTICVLMGMNAVETVVAGLLGPGKRAPDAKVAVIQWGTRAEQRVVTGQLAELPALVREAQLGSPAIIVVGRVVGLRETLRWFDNRPLFGKRVLVARPRRQSGGAARQLRLRGAEAVELPTIAIGPSPDPARVTAAARAVGTHDLVIFTSDNAVERFFAELTQLGRDARAFGTARVAAVGAGTAAALEARGVKADIVPTEFRAEGLVQALLDDPLLSARLRAHARHAQHMPNTTAPNTTAPNATTPDALAPVRVLLPRALVARELLPDRLRQVGCEVDVVPVYETHPVPAAQQGALIAALEARAIDVALLTSSSTVDSLCELLGARAPELLAPVLLASIGPITTAAAMRRGLNVALTAEVSTVARLIEAVEAYLVTSQGAARSSAS
ncbi:uroporphyrinogen-III C-methyltransferase [Chondromyces crocatus]|uniref:uroporphyrinogen-III C-methyltransferase n=1 Tax=Chondromyces crocatus TaxID=52 RepID=A0A0K1E5D5_CHOCO|nr:uroporphyrinogen-III C-methyltransferase [Chondromyces crocatus]AKT35907.1 uroporphyrin-III C-methyltransferase [Chondromyces crocatus]